MKHLIIYMALIATATAAPFHVFGIDNDSCWWPTDLKVEVFMRTGGKLYLLDNPDLNYNKTSLPESRIEKHPKVWRIRKVPKVWKVLRSGRTTHKASTTNDPNHPLHKYVAAAYRGMYSSKTLEFRDYCGTGRSFGVGIQGSFDWIKITVVERDIQDAVYEFRFNEADVNKDGIVDLRDLGLLNRVWMRKAKFRKGD